uniref:Uridine diphosphate glucose pyrophosphatase NUDT14 n=1 Tax=Heliothis virescens TaxID=7102 RepID=A0A2A4JZJ4_HELVI
MNILICNLQRHVRLKITKLRENNSMLSFNRENMGPVPEDYCVVQCKSKMSKSKVKYSDGQSYNRSIYRRFRKMEDLKKVYMTPLPDSPYVRPFRFNYTQGGKEKNWDMLEVHDSVAIIVFNVTRNVLVFVKQFRPAIYYNSVPPCDREDEEIDTEKYPASLGITLEMCAGIVDKNKSLQEIAREEVLEECGYDVPLKELQKIASYSVPPCDREDEEIDTEKYPASLGITLEMCAGIVDKNKSLQEIAREEVLEECGYDVPLKELQKIASYRAGVGVQGSLQTMFYCEVTDDMKKGKGGGVEDEIIEVVEKSISEVEKWISGPGPLNSPPSCLFALMWFLRNKADRYRK